MIKYIIFGAGYTGQQALYEIGPQKIAYFIDNQKTGKIGSKDVFSVAEGLEKMEDNMLILIPSKKHCKSMMRQLLEANASNFLYYSLGSMQLSSNEKKLDSEEWGKLYSPFHVDRIVKDVEDKKYTVWTKEIIKLTETNDSILELGCGSGQSSVSLAREGRAVTALDYSKVSIETTKEIASRLDVRINTLCYDATKTLPFKDGEFDLAFQAGLLEHFTTEEQIEMLSNWKRCARRMVSMIPNANSVMYRLGKEMMEKDESWPFGLEIPVASMYEVFEKSGYKNIREYSIGIENAKTFLPASHYLRVAMEKAIEEGYDITKWGQGYLLVTYGES